MPFITCTRCRRLIRCSNEIANEPRWCSPPFVCRACRGAPDPNGDHGPPTRWDPENGRVVAVETCHRRVVVRSTHEQAGLIAMCESQWLMDEDAEIGGDAVSLPGLTRVEFEDEEAGDDD